MTMIRRTHPITIVEFISRYLFLLLIPVIRGVYYLLTSEQDFYDWLGGTWADILVVLLILGFSYFRWYFQQYTFDEEGLHVRQGFFVRRDTLIPAATISTMSVEAPFYLRPLKAVRLSADTDAGFFRRADCRLTLPVEEARRMMNSRLPEEPAKQRVYRPRWTDVAFLSVIVSNTLTGVIFLATFINKAGDILGEEFRRRIIDGLEGIASRLMVFIPKTAALLALILLVGWGIGFIRNFFHYINFTARREEGTITVRSGWLTKREVSCRVDAVNYLDYRQSIITKLLRLYMVFIHCVGYGKGSDELAVLIPAADSRDCKRTLKMLLPEFSGRPPQIRPPRGSVVRYCMLPFWGCVLVPCAAAVAMHFLPDWRQLIFFLGVMLTIPWAWWLLLRIIDRFTAGVAVSSRQLTLRYSWGYAFHTVIIPLERINYVRVRYSIFQKWSGNCDVLFYTYGEVGHCHKVENLRMEDVKALLKILGEDASVLGRRPAERYRTAGRGQSR